MSKYSEDQLIEQPCMDIFQELTWETANVFKGETFGAEGTLGRDSEADVILKGTRVDGIYNTDPEKDTSAIKFDHITFDDVLRKGLKVMDTTAFTLSQENKLPIIVFDMNTRGNLMKVVSGEKIGTEVNI